MDRRITVGILIALPIMFLLGMVLFGRLDSNGDSQPTAQPTQAPVSSGLRTVVVEGVQVAIEPDSRQLILENESQPLYAIGVTVPVNTPIPTLNVPPTRQPGEEVVIVTREVTVEVTVLRFVDVTRMVDVDAPATTTPSFPPQTPPTPTPAPAPSPDTSGGITLENYTVREGDTLYGIAVRRGIDLNLIVDYNGYLDLIYPGDVIRLPRMDGVNVPVVPNPGIPGTCAGDDREYIVDLNDTVYSLAIEYGTSIDAIRVNNGLGFDYLIYPNQLLCIPR